MQVTLWLAWLAHMLFSLGVILSSLWVMLMLYIQQPFDRFFSFIAIVLWGIFALFVLGLYLSKRLISRTANAAIYLGFFAIVLIAYLALPAKQDRIWDPEVSRILHYDRQGELIRLHNIRNFEWQSDGSYIERWETRQFNLDDITGLNVVASYWMGPTIAHTLVSFDFKDQAPLTFSIEIRKEKNESFSAIGGFFRKYELSLVAADEKDIIYTRSNTRREQVYFFPLDVSQAEARALFDAYLLKADQLGQEAKWYNTLTSNCTTLVFDMVQAVSQQQLPVDYRILASGYLPNYLYDLNALNHTLDLKTWYQRAHVNPKVENYKQMDSQTYSQLIRSGLPAATLTTSPP